MDFSLSSNGDFHATRNHLVQFRIHSKEKHTSQFTNEVVWSICRMFRLLADRLRYCFWQRMIFYGHGHLILCIFWVWKYRIRSIPALHISSSVFNSLFYNGLGKHGRSYLTPLINSVLIHPLKLHLPSCSSVGVGSRLVVLKRLPWFCREWGDIHFNRLLWFSRVSTCRA